MKVDKVGRFGPPCFPSDTLNVADLTVTGKAGRKAFIRRGVEVTVFEWWIDGARKAPVSSCKSSPWCHDCTLKYQSSMLDEGRCNHPEIVFLPDEDGIVMGWDKNSATVRFELEEYENAPCPSCDGIRKLAVIEKSVVRKSGKLGTVNSYIWLCGSCGESDRRKYEKNALDNPEPSDQS